jgi:hypothetical protein
MPSPLAPARTGEHVSTTRGLSHSGAHLRVCAGPGPSCAGHLRGYSAGYERAGTGQDSWAVPLEAPVRALRAANGRSLHWSGRDFRTRTRTRSRRAGGSFTCTRTCTARRSGPPALQRMGAPCTGAAVIFVPVRVHDVPEDRLRARARVRQVGRGSSPWSRDSERWAVISAFSLQLSAFCDFVLPTPQADAIRSPPA